MTMIKFEDYVLSVNKSGFTQPLTNASVAVARADNGQPASLFLDAAGTQAIIALKTDAVGRILFYAAAGDYVMTVSGSGFTTFQKSVNVHDEDQDVMTVADYAALRAYSGLRQALFVTGYMVTRSPTGVSGLFVLDSTDTASIDNGGTVIVANNGSRWKRQCTRINLLHFMTDQERIDFFTGGSSSDHARAITAAVASVTGYGEIESPPGGLLTIKSPVSVGSSYSSDSRVAFIWDSSTPVLCTLPNAADIAFNFRNVPGHFNFQNMRKLRMSSTNGNGIGVCFNGQTFGGLEDCYIEGFAVGLKFSNAGAGTFTEFVRINRCEIHLNAINIQMALDGGNQISMHGLAFNDVTMNVGAGQIGLDINGIYWYNGSCTFRWFGQSGSTMLRMNCPTNATGASVAGSITCEGGPIVLSGTGRFQLDGPVNFMSGVTDSLSTPTGAKFGFTANNYFKPTAFGSLSVSTAPLRRIGGLLPNDSPWGQLVRLTASNSESLAAVMFATTDYFYTASTQTDLPSAVPGWGLRADGKELKSFAANGSSIVFTHGASNNPYGSNQTHSISDGKFYIGSANIAAGSGAPAAISWAGSSGDVYISRLSDSTAGPWFNKSGTWWQAIVRPASKQTVTGSRGGNAALASLLTIGASNDWWIDGTTA